MAEVKVAVTTSQGQVVGYFVNPKIENLCGNDWEISGPFVDEHGRPYEKVEFNPEALPYSLDLSQVPDTPVKELVKGYIQRGRQPIHLTAVRK